MSNSYSILPIQDGGVTSPAGFEAAGVVCGLKKSGNPDLALVFSKADCTIAGTFTSNRFPAAPVVLCRERVCLGNPVRALVINSGVANACTGEPGMANAKATCAKAAELLGITPEQVMVGSTGRIGTQLPMDKIFAGITEAVSKKSAAGGHDAAHAIMTTDTKCKEFAVRFSVNGKDVTVGGMTKGAGMIAPHMFPAVPHATMLCTVTTDAAVSKEDLCRYLADAVGVSFNRISVDNDMSTNDTCLLFANGLSGVSIRYGETAESAAFADALTMLLQHLAQAMVMDGEGASKMIEVHVTGARDARDAHLCVKAIADSMLCKTAWFGNDPNWGRVLAAAGYCGAVFHPDNVSMDYNDMPVVRGGKDAGTPECVLSGIMKSGNFTIHLDLGEGVASDTMWTSDLTYDYVKINADYHT